MKRDKITGESAETVEGLEFDPIQGYPMLQWKGKRPFTSTFFYPAQLKETHGQEVEGWRNRLYWGDNLQVMGHLLRKHRSGVKLIYVDPPFDSKVEYKKNVRVHGIGVEGSYGGFEEKQYTDIWTNDEYLQFMFERLILMRELLADNGVICLHCDWHKSHYLRCILDEVFGNSSFVNEVVWYYYNKMQGNVGRFASNHDTLLVYAKSPQFGFNKLRERRDAPIQQIKRVWNPETQSLVNAKDESGAVVYITSTHKTIDDVWRIPMLQPADKTELTDYPTQKPEAILERVILAFSDPSDLIFDCFMGSGTTQAVAQKLGRRFIGSDINAGAIDAARKRLLKISFEQQSSLTYRPSIKNGLSDQSLAAEQSDESVSAPRPEVWFTGLEVYNVNQYDVFRNPVQARELLVEALELQPLAAGSLVTGR